MGVADSIFLICLIAGGGLLLVSVVVGDLLGGVLDALHAGVDIGGVGLMPLVLGFVSMFGVGGLFSTQVFRRLRLRPLRRPGQRPGAGTLQPQRPGRAERPGLGRDPSRPLRDRPAQLCRPVA
ncbi:MAG: hypothetical protein E6J29_10815 [Chloroflexi bacterium]|nr:MAG: hypothetical protein E6J29_10815 [Chloroflexota bacterium]